MSSIKEHCCAADIIFDSKSANKQYNRYLKKGPTRVTARIIEQLSSVNKEGKNLLDIGGGIGALQWSFLECGGSTTLGVDASQSYLEKAKEHALQSGWQDSTQFIKGDFSEVDVSKFKPDIITLDKVICCYPDYKQILGKVCGMARQYISLSYPLDGFISKVIEKVGALFIKLKTKDFRPYVHNVSDVRTFIHAEGFERISHNLVFPWNVETYIKK